MGKIDIGIIDSQTLFRKGLVQLLNRNTNFRVVFEIEDGVGILEKLEVQLPEIIIIDLKIKPKNGIYIAEMTKKKYPSIKIVVLTAFYNPIFINLMSRIGINAFLSKQVDSEELYKAIDSVSKNRIYVTESYKDIILYSEGSDISSLHSKFVVIEKLSVRELEVLTLICHEFTNLEISKKLFLSIRTIEGHRNNLLSKTGAKNTVGLVLYALIYKLVEIDYKLLQISMNTPFNNGI